MEVQQELIRSNEMLSVQVWVLGGCTPNDK